MFSLECLLNIFMFSQYLKFDNELISENQLPIQMHDLLSYCNAVYMCISFSFFIFPLSNALKDMIPEAELIKH